VDHACRVEVGNQKRTWQCHYAADGSRTEMIEREKRLVVMAEEGTEPGDWYHKLWDYAQETSYPSKSPESFNCEPNWGGMGKAFF
jgi:hypothetical protein